MVIQSELLKVAEVEITYRPKFKVSERPQISQSKDAYNILIQEWDQGNQRTLHDKSLRFYINHLSIRYTIYIYPCQ
jgi:hypothetical protein